MIRLLKVSILLALAGTWVATSANATLTWTAPISLGSHDVVGAVSILQKDKASGSPVTELYFAQKLLDLVAPVAWAPDSTGRYWGTGVIPPNVDYSGTLSLDGALVSPDDPDGTGNPNYVPAGYAFVIAKYDGQNAGYIMFNLNGEDAYLPQTSASIWANGQGQGYGISGFTAFNPVVPEPTTVLAGLLLLVPFGLSAMRVVRSRK